MEGSENRSVFLPWGRPGTQLLLCLASSNSCRYDSSMFLPARRTDVIKGDVDLDQRHRELWEESDPRNKHKCSRPYPQKDRINNLMIAQGRVRRELNGKHTRYYVKDPEIWDVEAVDIRKLPCPEGRIRCQFCGLDYELPPKISRGPYIGSRYQFVACHRCSGMLNLEVHYKGSWDENRNLIQTG